MYGKAKSIFLNYIFSSDNDSFPDSFAINVSKLAYNYYYYFEFFSVISEFFESTNSKSSIVVKTSSMSLISIGCYSEFVIVSI